MLAGDPGQGGATWAILQYLHGLRRLGHDVLLVEPVAELRRDVVRYFDALGLEGSFLLAGEPPPEVGRFARTADLLLDVSGMLRDERLLESIPLRVFLDLDPAFSQIWAAQGIAMGFEAHTHFVTVGSAVGTADCAVPTLGRDWIPTLPPVVLDHWPRGNGVVRDALTTVGNWRAYGSVEHEGVFYGQKAHALRTVAALPARSPKPLELALAIDPGETRDLELLGRHGWRLLDPAVAAGTPHAYARFVRGSWAEFGLVKHGYVTSRCGWFSDRSACYLASGRPVVALDTGFSRFLPTGEGLFAAADVDGIVAAVEEIERNYARHANAARELAREHFESDRVLRRLLERVGCG
jgi:hypothetical protein